MISEDVKIPVYIDNALKESIKPQAVSSALDVAPSKIDVKYTKDVFSSVPNAGNCVVVSEKNSGLLPYRGVIAVDPGIFFENPFFARIYQPFSVEKGKFLLGTVAVGARRSGKAKFITDPADNKAIVEAEEGKIVTYNYEFKKTRDLYSGKPPKVSYYLRDADSDTLYDSEEKQVVISGFPSVYIVGQETLSNLYELGRSVGVSIKNVDEGVFSDSKKLQGCDLLIVTDLPEKNKGVEKNLSEFIEKGGAVLHIPSKLAEGYKSVLSASSYVVSQNGSDQQGKSISKSEELANKILLILLIDTSGSMAGKNLQMAKQASYAAGITLGKDDFLSVVGFSGDPYMALTPQQPNKVVLERSLARLSAGGSTNIYNALSAAEKISAEIDAGIKHVILFSDGLTPPADFLSKIEKFKKIKTTLSTVCLAVDQFDWSLMQQIASEGKGKSSICWDSDDLPQIFTTETKRIVNEREVKEKEPTSSVSEHQNQIYSLIKMAFLQSANLDKIRVPDNVRLVLNEKSAGVIGIKDNDRPFLCLKRIGLGKSCTLALKPSEFDQLLGSSEDFAGLFLDLLSFLKSGSLDIAFNIKEWKGLRILKFHDASIGIDGIKPLDPQSPSFAVPSQTRKIRLTKDNKTYEILLPAPKQNYSNPERVKTMESSILVPFNVDLRFIYSIAVISFLIYKLFRRWIVA
ncbi:MAG: VWA domain-containing protein [Planctomycetes bacterium]|nr:VWA domain-containing protein [Planctomycetota bacterium]